MSRVTRLALTIALAVIPGSMQAQQRVFGSLEVTPYGGLYMPTTTVISQFEPACPCDVSLKHNTAVLVGVRMLYWVSDRFGLEGSFGYSASGVTVAASGLGSADTSGNVIVGSARAIFQLNHAQAPTAVLAGAGLGVVSHGGAFYDMSGATGTTDVGGTVMLGVHSQFGSRLRVRLELEDYFYSASFGPSPNTDSKFQHDLVASMGLGIALGW